MFSRRPPGEGSGGGDDDDFESHHRRMLIPAALRSRRGALAVGVFLVVVIAGFGIWLAVRALDAKSNLEQARSSAQQTKDALLRGEVDEASRSADSAQEHAQAARDAAHSVPWNVAAAIPWLGDPFKSGQQITDVVLGLAADVLRPAVGVGDVVAPDRLFANGRVDVQLLQAQEPKLTELSGAAERLGADADAIRDPNYVSMLRDARSQLQDQTSDIAELLRNTALAARIAPSMMGAAGPRTYFMGFQTNAEARGTGGLLGGFGILRFDNGAATVDNLAPNTELTGPFTPIDLGPEYTHQYGWTNPSTDFRNSNQSPHFPYAAQIWKAMWSQQTGQNVDGAMAIDPIALSYILGAVGPITLADGEKITQDNVVELTESTAYVRFPTDQVARKQYLQDIANAVVKKVLGPIESPRELLDALGKAVGEGRIAVWSASPDDQRVLEETPLAHIVPDDPAPYAGVVINNLGGNKLDYYLKREIEYAADGCDGPRRNSTVTVRLTNNTPDAPLPEYVAGSVGFLPNVPLEIPDGTMLTSVRLLTTTDAQLVSAVANGQPMKVFSEVERGHPTFEAQVAIPRGQSGEVTFYLSEPTSRGKPRVPVQPLVDPVVPKVSVPECTG
jgi:hypothetical protein